MNQPTPTPPTVDALLALRGAACLVVIVAHCNAPRESLIVGNYDLSWLFFAAGGVAVRVFFGLSGYLMGKVFYTQRYTTDFKGTLRFWRNRALRIFPLYYFSIIILSVFVYPDILRPENWIYLLRLCTFTYHQVLPIGFNGALWSLSTEVQFYLFVPFLFAYLKYRLRDRANIFRLAVILIVGSFLIRYSLWQIVQTQFPPPEDTIAFVKYIYVPVTLNLDVFLCGFILNFWIADRDIFKQNKLISQKDAKKLGIIIAVAIYFITAYIKYYNKRFLWQIAPTISLLATCFFIIAFESGTAYRSFQKTSINREFSIYFKYPVKIFEIFGILSYGMYVWHWPIISRVQSIFTSDIPIEAYLKQLAISWILSTLLAGVTYYYIEIPKMIKK